MSQVSFKTIKNNLIYKWMNSLTKSSLLPSAFIGFGPALKKTSYKLSSTGLNTLNGAALFIVVDSLLGHLWKMSLLRKVGLAKYLSKNVHYEELDVM